MLGVSKPLGGAFADVLRLVAISGLTTLFYWAATEKRVQFMLSQFSALVISVLTAEWYLSYRLESLPDGRLGALFLSVIVAWFVAAGGLTTLFYRIVR